MQKEIISTKEGLSLIIMFIFGSTLVLGTGSTAKKDVGLAIIIAILLAILLVSIYIKILQCFIGKDIFQINLIVFGNIIGKIINIFHTWFALHLGGLVLRNFGEFISIIGLSETPQIVSVSIISILCYWGMKNGIECIGKVSVFILFIIMIMLGLNILTSIIAFDKTNFSIYNTNYALVLKGAFSSLSFPFGESVVFLMIFSCLKDKSSIKKTYIYGILISGFVILLVSLRNLLVLSENIMVRMYFPSYIAISRVEIADIFQRLEIVVAVTFVLTSFIKVCICSLAATKGFASIFNIESYRKLAMPVNLLMINICFWSYESIMETRTWLVSTWPYYAIFFQAIIPIITLATIKLRKKFVKTYVSS